MRLRMRARSIRRRWRGSPGRIGEGDGGHDRGGQQQQDAGAPGGGAPFGQRASIGWMIASCPKGASRLRTVASASVPFARRCASARPFGEDGERLRRPEMIGERALVDGALGQGGDDLAVGVGDGEDAPARLEARQRGLEIMPAGAPGAARWRRR